MQAQGAADGGSIPGQTSFEKVDTSSRRTASAGRVNRVVRGYRGHIRGAEMGVNDVNERRDVGASS